MLEYAARNIAGFTLQILPVAVLCLAFFRGRFTVPTRSIVARFAAVLVPCCLVFTAVGSSHLPGDLDSYRFLFQNLIFFVAIAAFAVFYLRSVRACTAQKLFVFLVGAAYGCLVMYVQDLLYPALGLPLLVDGYMYPPAKLLVSAMVNALGFVPLLIAILRSRRPLGAIGPALWARLCLIPAAFLFVGVLGNWIPFELGLTVGEINYVLSTAFVLMGIVASLWAARLLARSAREAAERTNLEAEVRGFRHLAESAERLGRLRHDMNHHLQAVAAYLRADDVAGAQAYLDRAGALYADAPVGRYCDHVLVNAMLAEYSERARESGVRLVCEVTVPSQVNVRETDLCRLVTNLIDNALEGCARLRLTALRPAVAPPMAPADTVPTRPTIHFKMRQDGAFLFVSCQNPCDEQRLVRRGSAFATSKGEAGHGLGLSILAEIADAYNGTFRCEAKDGAFVALVNLCPKEEA